MEEAKIKELFEAHSKAFFERMDAAPAREQTFTYSNRFVAFLDILGFREIVREMASKTPNELFHSVVDSFWFHSASSALQFEIMSDSVLISSKDDHPSSFITVASTANNLRNSFLERGIVLRGAITFGRHFNSHEICISPALIEAYELESQVAKVPRIVCAKSALDYVLPAIVKNDTGRLGIVGPFGFHIIRDDQLPVQDEDGVTVLPFSPDTLEAFYLRTGHHHDPSYTPSAEQLTHFRTVGPELLKRWRAGALAARARCKTEPQQAKLEYLVSKWNAYIDSFVGISAQDKESYKISAT